MGQIEDFRLFKHVVEQQSIAKAAEKLNIAKSAVSRRLKLLEERFDASLITREPGVWEVTATGLEFYQRILHVVGGVDDIEADFTRVSQEQTGSLAISVPRDFGLSYLSEALLDFEARYPAIQLIVDFDDREVDLVRENYDLAIRISADLAPGLIAKPLGKTSVRFYASPEYLIKYKEPVEPRDLKDSRVVTRGMAKRQPLKLINSNNKSVTVDIKPSMNTNSGVFMRDAAITGRFIVGLPEFIAASAVDKGELVQVLTDWRLPGGSIDLVYAENRQLNRRMRLFVQEMEHACMHTIMGSK
jgi:DNA-binding transcriptional LysR family regulator